MKKIKSNLIAKVNSLFKTGITINCTDLRKMIAQIRFTENEKELENSLDVCKEAIKKNNTLQLYLNTVGLEYSKLSITEGVLFLRKHDFNDLSEIAARLASAKKEGVKLHAKLEELKELEILNSDNEKRVIVMDRYLRKIACDNTHIHFNVVSSGEDGQLLTLFTIRNGSNISYKNFYFISEEDAKILDKEDGFSLAFIHFIKYFSDDLKKKFN